MIGSLQRQLDVATGRLNAGKPNGSGRKQVAAARGSAKAKSGMTATRAAARKKSSARKSTKKR
jgi:hypothetical protein